MHTQRSTQTDYQETEKLTKTIENNKPVSHDGLVVVDVHLLVWIDCHQHDTTVGVDLISVNKPAVEINYDGLGWDENFNLK